MTTTHSVVTWFSGDDWEIRATLLDENGAPYNLAGGATVLWSLLNKSQQRVLDEDDVIFTVTDAAAGKCKIMVPSNKTSPLPGGSYFDTLRIVTGGITSTLGQGPIFVIADPWRAIEAPAVLQPVLRRVS